ncbi:MAG TPA: hypothetical protein VKI44_10495 [Acetobacteraceae bacterium]|nr:hypothetical protein [Acetobacteraceae bacterium]
MTKRAAGVVVRIVAVAAVLALPGLRSAWAGGPYDGTYHGTLTGGSANAASCAKRAPIQMTVTDSKLEYHHFSNTVITAPVGADGSFSGSAQNLYAGGGSRSAGPQVQTLSGKITGTAIQAETKVGGYCTYELALTKFQ